MSVNNAESLVTAGLRPVPADGKLNNSSHPLFSCLLWHKNAPVSLFAVKSQMEDFICLFTVAERVVNTLD